MIKPALLPVIIVVLVIVATGQGLVNRGDGSPAESQTVRGQHFSYLTTGVYRFNPVSFAREGRIWDGVNLFVAVPLFVLAWFSALRAWLCSIAMAMGSMMYITIPCWITIPLIQDGRTDVVEAIPFFVLSLAGIALAVVFYARLPVPDESGSRERRPQALARP